MGTQANLHRIALWCPAIAAAYAVVALIGWLTGELTLARLHPLSVPMAPSTAVAFALLGCATLLGVRRPASRVSRYFEIGSVALVTLLSALPLAQSIVEFVPDLEDRLFGAFGLSRADRIGYMSPVTAGGFLLAAVALLLLSLRPPERSVMRETAACLSLAVVAGGLAVLLGYLYGTPLFYAGSLIPVALPTAITFLALGLGTLAAAGPDTRVMRAIAGPSTQSRLLRAFLPTTLLVVVFEGWSDAIIFRAARVNPVVVTTITAAVSAAIIAMLVYWTARRIGADLERAEQALRESEEKLRQAHKLESVGRLAGGVAHDFNNLLTVINGYSDVLLGRLPQGDPSRNSVSEIRKAGGRAAALTRQLLAFSRKQILEPKVVDLNAIVANVQKMLRRLIDENVELVMRLGAGLDPVLADVGQVEQVLMNLVVNARDAMPDGGKVVVETANVEVGESGASRIEDMKPGAYVLLTVTDTGRGMDRDTQARIFEPFFTTKEKGVGTGLGLATVYGIVKQSGGWIAVASELDRGATFKIYFPRVTAAKTEEAAPARPSNDLNGTESILLVEDHDDVRLFAATVLTGRGYSVTPAASGAEALRLSERCKEPIQLLITDVVMPGMNGRELAERLRPLRPGMKVLYMSGYTNDVIAQHGVLDEGMEYLQKPFTPEMLAAKVREALKTA